MQIVTGHTCQTSTAPCLLANNSTNQIVNETTLDPRRVRAEVERVLDLYLSVEFFSLSGGATIRRMVAAAAGEKKRKKAERKGKRDPEEIHSVCSTKPEPSRVKSCGVSISPADKSMALWKATIGRKLSRLERRHETVLIDAAETRRQIDQARNQTERLSFVLDSPSRSIAIRKFRSRVQDLRDITNAMAEQLAEDRNRLVRGGLYREAVILFWMAITATEEIRAYCLREVDE